MEDFDLLVDYIQSQFDMDDATARLDVGHGRVPMAHFHLQLDGKEYIIAIIPTDLDG